MHFQPYQTAQGQNNINIASLVRPDGGIDLAWICDRNAHDDLVELRCGGDDGLCGRTLVVALGTDRKHDLHDDWCVNIKQAHQLLRHLSNCEFDSI